MMPDGGDPCKGYQLLFMENVKMRAALIACVDYWRDTEVPCPPALHDQVTTALGGVVKQATAADSRLEISD